MRLIAIVMGIVAAFTSAAPASSEWLKATSRHFVVYSNTDEPALRRSAVELERFDAMIRLYHRTGPDTDAEYNRVTVYVMPNVARVGQIAGMRNAAGFYVPRVTGSIAFTPKLGGNGDNDITPRIVLFHEYAHHFLLGNSRQAYPAWFSEGYAEFASTMKQIDGAYWLGVAADHRAYGLFDGKALSIRQLFAPPAKMTDRQEDALYGRGWLLTHYLMFDVDRRKQLSRYLELFNAGKSSLDAATEVFGDLEALDDALDAYLKRRKLPGANVAAADLGTPTVEVRPLTLGEAALIGYRMTSTRGVTSETAGPIYAKAAAAAAPFGKDPAAQGWLAEMAFDAGKLAEAAAAADAALAVDPTSSQALLYKARIGLAQAAEANAEPKAWAEARGWIVKANRAQPNDAAALALFYESYLQQKVPPTKSAVAGLYRALDLVPQDDSLRFLAARQMILDEDSDGARQLLRPLAASPHAPPDNAAARLLKLLDSGVTGHAAFEALEKAAAAASETKRD